VLGGGGGAVVEKIVLGGFRATGYDMQERNWLYDKDTHVLAGKLFWAMGLSASTTGHTVTGDSPRLAVPEDTPPLYAES
jgi:hypothetical protein